MVTALLPDLKQKIHTNEREKPSLNEINYIWVNNILNKKLRELNPTVAELLEWITSGKIDAKHK